MGAKNPHLVITAYAESCIKAAAHRVARQANISKSDVDEIGQTLRCRLWRRLKNYDPARSQFNTFCSHVVKNLAWTLLREYRKHGDVVFYSLHDPIERDSGDRIERVETIDQQDYQRDVCRQDHSKYELLTQYLDINKVIDEIEDNQLKTVCNLLKHKNPQEISQETGIPRATIYQHIKKLRSIFTEKISQINKNEFRHSQRSFSKKRKGAKTKRRIMRGILTFSSVNAHQVCPSNYYWRYEKRLVSLEKDPAQSFGTTMHKNLERWHRERTLEPVLQDINRIHPNIKTDPRAKKHWHMAKAMMTVYDRLYQNDNFEVVCLEKRFKGPIVNPATGAISRSFMMAGVVDGVMRKFGENFLIEHKTASQINGSYLERLWTNLQILIYWHYIQRELNIKISGVIYNILVKPKLKLTFRRSQVAFCELAET